MYHSTILSMTRMQFEKDILVLNPPAEPGLMKHVSQENDNGAESIEEGHDITIICDANPPGRAHRTITLLYGESLATLVFDGFKDEIFRTVEEKAILIRLGRLV